MLTCILPSNSFLKNMFVKSWGFQFSLLDALGACMNSNVPWLLEGIWEVVFSRLFTISFIEKASSVQSTSMNSCDLWRTHDTGLQMERIIHEHGTPRTFSFPYVVVSSYLSECRFLVGTRGGRAGQSRKAGVLESWSAWGCHGRSWVGGTFGHRVHVSHLSSWRGLRQKNGYPVLQGFWDHLGALKVKRVSW